MKNQMSDWQPREQVDNNVHAEMEAYKWINMEQSDKDEKTRAVADSIFQC